jgi:hypothetical protein
MHGWEFQLTDKKLFVPSETFLIFCDLKVNAGCSGPASGFPAGCSGPASVCPRAVVSLLEFAF